jgi:hypothetical protein
MSVYNQITRAMEPDPDITQAPTPRRFVSITRTVRAFNHGYFLDAIADDGTAWYYITGFDLSCDELGWKQHGALPPIS